MTPSLLCQIHMQSCILAGGVAVGVAMPAVVQPWEAMTIGFAAAMISTLGFRYLKVLTDARTRAPSFTLSLHRRFSCALIFQVHMLLAYQCHDTCAALSTHGLPGLLGWLAQLLLQIRDCDDHTT